MAAPVDKHVKHHAEPRITANELARFMVVSDVSRLTIIRNAREAKTSIVVRYKQAREAINNYLTSVTHDIKIINAAHQLLKQKAADPALKAFARQDAELSAEAIAAIAKMANVLGPIDFQPAPQKQAPIVLSGVTVSVHLDTLVHAATKKKSLIGGSLLRLTKADGNESDASAAKRQAMGGYAATLGYLHVLEHFNGKDDREASPIHCYSIDIQYGEMHTASASMARKVDNLKAACQMIAALWKSA